MNSIIAYFIVFILGATPFMEIAGVIPLGVAAGLPTTPVTILAFSGNILTIWLLIILMDHVMAWLQKRKENKGKQINEKRQKRANKLWKKYGLPGLAILSPLLIGSHLGVVLAMGLGGTRGKITIWMTVSIIAWAISIGFASYFGIEYLLKRTDNTGFLNNLIEIK